MRKVSQGSIFLWEIWNTGPEEQEPGGGGWFFKDEEESQADGGRTGNRRQGIGTVKSQRCEAARSRGLTEKGNGGRELGSWYLTLQGKGSRRGFNLGNNIPVHIFYIF